jgi:hypothetical protein
MCLLIGFIFIILFKITVKDNDGNHTDVGNQPNILCEFFLVFTLGFWSTLHNELFCFITESECSDSCSECSSNTYTDDETSSTEVKTKPPPLPRITVPIMMPVPIAQTEPSSAHSIRPNLHQYLERDNTIWTTNTDDQYVKITNSDRIKSIMSNKWMDNMSSSSKLCASMPTLAVISENPTKISSAETKPRHEDKTSKLRNVYHLEMKHESLNPQYRYNSYLSNANNKYNFDNGIERVNRPVEKNKVKFSDTVTVAVVSVRHCVSQ